MGRFPDLWGIIFPRKCVFCGCLLETGQDAACDSCLNDVTVFRYPDKEIPGVTEWTAVWHYDELVRKAILDYKFGGKQHYSRVFGRFLAEKIAASYLGRYDILTYVPISFRRKLKRGYDQVLLLARSAGSFLGSEPVATLKKTRHNRAQSSLEEGSLRVKNVQGVYQAKTPGLVAGKRILLIDDIITTGATVSECAKTLLAAGAAEVLCVAVAAGRGRNR